jgi:iron complex transport system substrate-binding protein
MTNERHRAARVLLGTLVITALVAAACSSSSSSAAGPTGSSSAGPWTYTDGRGETVTLDEMPTNIVAYAPAPLDALMRLGVEPVGAFGGPLDGWVMLDGLDMSGVENVGEVYGEINLEALAALQPDLIVSAFDPRQTALPPFGISSEKQYNQVSAVAPVVAIDSTKDNSAVIEDFETLAGALGADLASPSVVAAHDAFDAAVADLQAATAENPGVLASGMSAYEGDQVYLAHPSAFPTLRDYETWGLELLDPPGQEPAGDSYNTNYFWKLLSFENADSYPTDLLLYDSQSGGIPASKLPETPTLDALPSVETGQVAQWSTLAVWSAEGYAKEIQGIADAVREADPDLVT